MGQPAFTGLALTLGEKPPRLHVVPPPPGGPATSTDLSNARKRRATYVQQFDAFLDIPVADCMAIIESAQERHFRRHHTIFFEGDPIRQVVLLLSGCLKITQLGANGQEVILRLNGPGELLGGLGKAAAAEHFSSAQTLEESTALVWEASQFEVLLERLPILRRNMAHALERHLNELEVRFREVSTEKVGSRLSSLLVRLVGQVGKRGDDHVEVALSRRELAQLTGTTLFTVSRLLCLWETRGIVSARREAVLVHDLPALQELSREE
jgi:CRP/FNR family transcriptional regulator, nitrogen oxide reductase regulator